MNTSIERSYIIANRTSLSETAGGDYIHCKEMDCVDQNDSYIEEFFSMPCSKRMFAMSLACPSTIVEDYISSTIDTLISIGPSYYAFISRVLASTGEDFFLYGYDIYNPSVVSIYLKSNSDLLFFINNLSSSLLGLESINSLDIECYQDLDDLAESLYITANTKRQDAVSLIQLEDQLYARFFEPEVDLIRGRVIFSLS